MIIVVEVRLFCRNTMYIHMHVCTSRMYCVKYVKFICNIFSHKNLKLHGSSQAPHWGAVFSFQIHLYDNNPSSGKLHKLKFIQ